MATPPFLEALLSAIISEDNKEGCALSTHRARAKFTYFCLTFPKCHYPYLQVKVSKVKMKEENIKITDSSSALNFCRMLQITMTITIISTGIYLVYKELYYYSVAPYSSLTRQVEAIIHLTSEGCESEDRSRTLSRAQV